MLRKTVAASVIAVWFALFAIESSEDAGLIKQMDTDKSVETGIASFGVAFRALDDLQPIMSPALTLQPHIFDTSADRGLFNLGFASHLGKEAQFLKGHFKIFRLLRVLLI